ncbi:hypothetical protein J6590_103533 [Homalodisca vitripennis]|nr:hypothetical protein J6590_103533 [Homalodisca vitripennis]
MMEDPISPLPVYCTLKMPRGGHSKSFGLFIASHPPPPHTVHNATYQRVSELQAKSYTPGYP